jgi:hypothetical protein
LSSSRGVEAVPGVADVTEAVLRVFLEALLQEALEFERWDGEVGIRYFTGTRSGR